MSKSLQIAVCDQGQMQSLLSGLEVSLYMANRLRAYSAFLKQIPAGDSRELVRNHMVDLYALVLGFFAAAIRHLDRSALRKAFHVFGSSDQIGTFEADADKIATRIEAAARACDRDLAAEHRNLSGEIWNLLDELKQVHHIQESINRVYTKVSLSNFPFAASAIYDAMDMDDDVCHGDTRSDILQYIKNWVLDLDSKHIFWLSGIAGVGKSTILRTIANWLTNNSGLQNFDYGASFFFRRGDLDCVSAKKLIPTIARQLSSRVAGLAEILAEATRNNDEVFYKALAEQFRQLIIEPLQKIKSPRTVVWVLDALDECNSLKDQSTLLQLLALLPKITTVRVKVILTSRPEVHIANFLERYLADAYVELAVQDAQLSTINHDILIYLRDRFARMRVDHNANPGTAQYMKLEDDWPDLEVIQKLVKAAVPLFIVAATFCRLMSDDEQNGWSPWNPKERLEMILNFESGRHLPALTKIYLPVLARFTAGSNPKDNASLTADFRKIVGTIILAAVPLSIDCLSILLKMDQREISQRLQGLYSVLRISPKDPEMPIQTLHLTFREFLLSDNLCEEQFRIDGPKTHHEILKRCIDVMSDQENGLCEDMCHVRHPGTRRAEIHMAAIEKRFPAALRYACQYWTYHAANSEAGIEDDSRVYHFLKRHFLHWLEALSLLSCLSDVLQMISNLQAYSSVSSSISAAQAKNMYLF